MVGARIARALCPRFGMSAAGDGDRRPGSSSITCSMSLIAFSRDIGDPKTIRDFANIVQSPERLKLLLVLTVADIRAVGPGVWNGWKGQLLRGALLRDRAGGGGQATRFSRARARGARPRPPSAPPSPTGPAEELERFIDRHYPDYWLRTEHAQGRRARQAGPRRRAAGREARHALSPPTPSRPSPSCRCSRPTIPRLLALFAGACAASGANISARTSRPRATASRSTPSCSSASSTMATTKSGGRRRSPDHREAAEGRDAPGSMWSPPEAQAEGAGYRPSRVEPQVVIDNTPVRRAHRDRDQRA